MFADGGGRDVQPFPHDDAVSWQALPSLQTHESTQQAAVYGTNAERYSAAVTQTDAGGRNGQYPGDDEVVAKHGRHAGHSTWDAEYAILNVPVESKRLSA